MLKFKFFKRVLMVSCLSIHLAYSAEELPDLGLLQGQIQTASQRVMASREDHADTNSVIVIGRTGRGKSTLITHLADRPLVAKAGVTGFTLNTDLPLPDFRIQEDVAVGTTVPNSWYDPTSDVVYWDCPGFGDPRGAEKDIVNAFSIQQLFQAPSRAKIVIAAQESDLQGKAESFGTLLNQVVETFPESSQLERCLSLVVTRQRDVDVGGVLGMIYAAAEESELFRFPRVKSLVRFLRDNVPTRVSCMPYPAAAGAYAGNRASILGSIASADYVLNPVFRLSISPASKLLVMGLAAEINERVIDNIRVEISALMERQILGFITGHEKTARAMKADFSTYAADLMVVRNDTPGHFFQDLFQIFERVAIPECLDRIKRSISIIDFFKSIEGRVEHRVFFWRGALEDLIRKIDNTSKAPEVIEEKRGRHLRTWEEYQGNRSEGEARGGRSSRVRRDVHMGVDCYEYAVDEKIITTFPPIGRAIETVVVDDWAETGRVQTERSGQRIIGYGAWH